MAYLFIRDFARQIQADNLNQIISGDSLLLSAAIGTAVEEAKSYLVQKFDCTSEFRDTNEWDNSISYKAGDRVYLDAPAWVANKAYNANDRVSYNKTVYIAPSPIVASASFQDNLWAVLGTQYAVFNVPYPQPIFSFTAQYAKGDKVFYKNKVYTCAIQTQPYSQTDMMQFRQYQSVPYKNVAPDNVNNGKQYWGTGVPFSIPAGMPPMNTTFWARSDNRSQQLVTATVDIALYHLHSRIAPRNIPDLRVKRYDDALEWLRSASRGDITPALPPLIPAAGNHIRYGGNVKQVNNY